jgi:hypothetical protein
MANINKNKKYHFIYKTTNLLNNKFYIGMHSTSNLKDGYLGSGKYLRNSIKKYGKENFKIEILEYCDTRENLIAREKEIVNEGLLKNIFCMNLQLGGGGGFSGDLHKSNFLTASLRHRFPLPEYWYTDNNKQRRSESLKMRHAEGRYKNVMHNGFKGKTHSEETIKRLKKSHEGKHKGDKNSQYGTCWINKNGMYKKIYKGVLNEYIFEGWAPGRSGFKK